MEDIVTEAEAVTQADSDALPRTLTRDELRAEARALASAAGKWRHLVEPRADQRVFVEVATDATRSVWMIGWMSGHDTGFHDHDGSSGAVIVLEGGIREETLRPGHVPFADNLDAGDVFDFGPKDIHRVTHRGDEPTVTLHVYSPPLTRMGAYSVDDGGELTRQELDTTQELRAAPIG